MQIRLAKQEDIASMMTLINDAKERLAAMGLDQWQDGYPNEDSLQKDIARGEAYVGVAGDEIVVTLALCLRDDPTYAAIDGAWITEHEPYGVIHRLAVKEDHLGKGLAQAVFRWAETQLLNRGISSMKVDTHKDNRPMQRLLRRLGYVYTGIIYVRDDSSRDAFEKTLFLGEMPRHYHTFLLDADETLLDFQTSQNAAFSYACQYFGVEPSHALIQSYAQLNRRYWLMFERGEISKENLVIARFEELIRQHHLPGVGADWENLYQTRLAQGFDTIPYAHEVLSQLHQKATLACITNGVASTQQNRLTHSGLAPYFDAIFISETVGSQKPDIAYFQYVQQALHLTDWNGVLLVGDSPTSDMKGGFRTGIDTCWFHEKTRLWNGLPEPDYRITDLRQLLAFVNESSELH